MQDRDKNTLAMIQDHKFCFSTPEGKRVLDRLKTKYYNTQSFVPGDPYFTAFHEGQRALVSDILKILEQDVKELEKQYKEKENAQEPDTII